MMSSSKTSRLKTANTALAVILWFILLTTIAELGLAYTLPQDLLKTSHFYATLVEASFFGRVLTFHFALLLTFIAIFALSLRRPWMMVISTMAAIALAFPTFITMTLHDPPKSSGPNMRVMSMNLKYTYSNGDLIIAQVRKFNPDVLVLQDYTPFAQFTLEKEFGADYPYRYLLYNYLQGLAIFSRLPFDGPHPRTTFNKTRRQMRAVVVFNGQPIVIYIEHPYSPRSRQRILSNRLSTVDLANQVRAEKFPVIVAGDFNFTTETPNEAKLKSIGLQDGFELAGHGRGSTWPVSPQWMQWLPGVRIDHIFVSPTLTCTQFFVGDYDGSDHLPIVADIAQAESLVKSQP